MKKIVLIGSGNICSKFLSVYDDSKYEIVKICDNSASKQGSKLQNIEITSIEELKKMEYDYICITCNAYDKIVEQLRSIGIQTVDVLDFSFLKDYRLIDENLKCIDIIKKPLQLVDSREEAFCIYENRMFDINMILSAKNISKDYKGKAVNSLSDIEFRCFSQNGEDGIIQWIVNNIDIEKKIFVEFGVEDYKESNTRFLLMNNNWSGLVIDGSKENVQKIQNWSEYWRYDLIAKDAFITKENIDELITEEGISGEIGLLSVDIDGNDYWVLDSIQCISPIVLICEYNSVFGSELSLSTPYKKDFFRTEEHYSNLYYGASLRAFIDWAKKKDYTFLGCNSAGNNAFFVKKDYWNNNLLLNQPCFMDAKVRESRDINGCLSYLRGKERVNEIKNLEVVNLKDYSINKVGDIL